MGLSVSNVFSESSTPTSLKSNPVSCNRSYWIDHLIKNSFRYHHALLIPVGTRDWWSKWKWHWFEHTGAEYFPWTSKHVSCTSIALPSPSKFICLTFPFSINLFFLRNTWPETQLPVRNILCPASPIDYCVNWSFNAWSSFLLYLFASYENMMACYLY